jgi:hypothetical protein
MRKSDIQLPPMSWIREITQAACDVVQIVTPETLDEKMDLVKPRLMKQWYDSKETDYSVYNDPEYPIELIHCWRRGGGGTSSSNTTRGFVRWLAERKLSPQSFIDYHGGLGLTCAQLGKSFPDAKIMYHTVVDTHAERGLEIFKRVGVSNVQVVNDLKPAEVFLAQETMEHFPDPVAEIERSIDIVKPRFYVDGSSFSIDACGHFRHNKRVRRRFNAKLTQLGYTRYWHKENCDAPFNGHPAIWVQNDEKYETP